jgi:hypothetical protein
VVEATATPNASVWAGCPELERQPFSGLNNRKVHDTTVLFCSAELGNAHRRLILRELDSWPAPLLKTIASNGVLYITRLSQAEFAERFPTQSRVGDTTAWRRGYLYIAEAEDCRPEADAITRILFPVRESLQAERKRAAAWKARRQPLLLVPSYDRLSTEMIQQMVTNGVRLPASRHLLLEGGAVEFVDVQGKSSHRLRVRATNPAFNQWVYHHFVDPLFQLEPSVNYYLGLNATVETKPYALLGILSWGADADLITLGGTELYLDANIQYRLHSSDPLSTDGVALEVTPHLKERRERKYHVATGFTMLLRVYPSPDVRGGVSGKISF